MVNDEGEQQEHPSKTWPDVMIDAAVARSVIVRPSGDVERSKERIGSYTDRTLRRSCTGL
jgi:hypothetical protein